MDFQSSLISCSVSNSERWCICIVIGLSKRSFGSVTCGSVSLGSLNIYLRRFLKISQWKPYTCYHGKETQCWDPGTVSGSLEYLGKHSSLLKLRNRGRSATELRTVSTCIKTWLLYELRYTKHKTGIKVEVNLQKHNVGKGQR